MKVGILTYQFSQNNYGAVLQTYASFQILKKLGHEPQIINLLPGDRTNWVSDLKNNLRLHIFKNIHFEYFKKKYLELTNPYYHSDDMSDLNSIFDAFYVGSDQVWRASMSKERLMHYFLDFVDDNKIKIAYAASFGISKWEGNNVLTNKVNSLIKRFNYIGVREKVGISICKHTFNVDSTQVLDPTLLLDEEDYFRLLKRNRKFDKGSYIAYHLIQDRQATGSLWRQIENNGYYKVINLFGEIKSLLANTYLRYNSIEQWLYGVKNASLIITDSFHCVIFSIIFRKNFVCVPNMHGGISRIHNLLSMLGIEDRLSKSKNLNLNYFISNPINYSKVKERLSYHIDDSINFISKALTQ